MEGPRNPDHRSPDVSPPAKRRAQQTPPRSARRSLAGQFGSPSGSPVTYSDRFVPSRSACDLSVEFQVASNALAREKSNPASPPSGQAGNGANSNNNNNANKDRDENSFPRSTYEAVLRSELFGDGGSPLAAAHGAGVASPHTAGSPARRGNLLQFSFDVTSSPRGSPQLASPFSLSPLSEKSKELLVSPQKTPRKISRAPYKVLEAPAIQDDFYLNLIDWGSQNVLAVGLGSCVYLWNAQTAQVSKLTDVGVNDLVASVSWMSRGSHIAIGTNSGSCVVWDAVAGCEVRSLSCHKSRVGTLCWNGSILTSGSRDRFIYHHDVRSRQPYVAKLIGHKQEVCGLRWSPDGQYLASGGNDNRLLIWSPQMTLPVQKYTDHSAAVKAIAWSPHQRGLLASGGGTADRTIRFRNILTSTSLHTVDTGSQVCNLAWSKNVNELVSTHGYSQNQIIVWSYPSMTQLARLTGHTMRVLYLAVSPDGQTIVTGAGDETLRFWAAFPPSGSKETARAQVSAGSSIVIR